MPEEITDQEIRDKIVHYVAAVWREPFTPSNADVLKEMNTLYAELMEAGYEPLFIAEKGNTYSLRMIKKEEK